MSHNSHKFAFKLSSTNYGYCKAIIQPFLITNNLFGYVDGSIPCPSEFLTITASAEQPAPKPPTNPNHSTWISNDAHVRMLLLSTISESAFGHVQNTNTSRDLWLSLERAYAPNTISREFTLKQQLLKIEMKGDETPSAYLERAREYADALANIGEPVKDKDLVLLVIAGLRDEYHSLKGNIVSRQQPPSFNELHALLSDHDFLVRKPPAIMPPTQAYSAVTSPTPQQPSSQLSHPTIQALQQLLTQLNISPSQPAPSPQAYYSNRSGNRGRGSRRGRGSYHNSAGNNSRNSHPNRRHPHQVPHGSIRVFLHLYGH
ncbi:hypothetical protein E3N88_03654 [Mikania micrantha]|uniref:Uncharacterized protein n=1 Tax=Mikania micrantha TaxID=192012 RepID=A0A5N6Q9H7_9ASTR|nr:hypothetical protein E3N88_03654 [Mikania micrantha]